MATITFLGTGGDAFTVGKGLLSAGGIVLELEDNLFLLDPGPGSLMSAKQAHIDLRKLVAVLVSNNSLNASNDVNAVLSALSYAGLDRHGVLLAADSVISGRDGVPAILRPEAQAFTERSVSLDGVPRVGINSVNIAVTAAKSEDSSAVGFQFRADKEIISYTGDTGLTDEVVRSHMDATVLIANVSLPEDEHSDFHLSVADVISLARQVRPRLLVVTGFSQQLLKLGARGIGRRISQDVSCHVLVAEDLMHIDPSIYR